MHPVSIRATGQPVHSEFFRQRYGRDRTLERSSIGVVYSGPNQGAASRLNGDTYYSLKLLGEQTGGALTLLEAVVPPAGGPPRHIHQREDEVFVVLEGALWFLVGGRSLRARAGSCLFVPKGTPHRFKNPMPGTARMLIAFTPAGLDGMATKVQRS